MSDWHNWLTDPAIQILLSENASKDPAALALQWSGRKDLPVQWMLQQIEGRQKAKFKIPSWFHNKDVVYPDRTALEQCSSEITAGYKKKFSKGKRVADLTGGLGVDSKSFAENAAAVMYFEPDPLRFEIAKHNFKVFNLSNITCVNDIAENAGEHLKKFKPDIIYIDPSRRDKGKRVFRFEDLQPDIIPLIPQWLDICENILLKAAPMFDIKQGIRQLEKVQEVHVISTKNECRELLFYIGRQKQMDPAVHCIEFNNERDWKYAFHYGKEESLPVKLSPVSAYISDPFASVTKAGAFKSLTEDFDVALLHVNTHLYTSAQRPKGFPGRKFKVVEIFPYDAGLIRESLKDKKAHLVFRNFPVKPEEVEKKLKFTSGGNSYLFFVTDHSDKLRIIHCRNDE